MNRGSVSVIRKSIVSAFSLALFTALLTPHLAAAEVTPACKECVTNCVMGKTLNDQDVHKFSECVRLLPIDKACRCDATCTAMKRDERGKTKTELKRVAEEKCQKIQNDCDKIPDSEHQKKMLCLGEYNTCISRSRNFLE